MKFDGCGTITAVKVLDLDINARDSLPSFVHRMAATSSNQSLAP
jgi:hypothetical protein